ncbi:MAG TPA: hypothetical protein VGQ57_21970 [Polyangiaceae bacterium]|nr:hypothetical protein [Polyangiaceae bacterium]
MTRFFSRLLAAGAFGGGAVVFAVALGACGGGGGGSPSGGGDDGDDSTPFLAFAKDFTGYHSWQGLDVTGGADLAGIHDGSTVIEYLNHEPPSGRSDFPKKTIIVKEATGGTIPHEIFAMVKRGAGFNSGLPGWEWFELENIDDGSDRVNIVWHGFGPPNGEAYGGDSTNGCNTCHLACGNDGVCAKELALENF